MAGRRSSISRLPQDVRREVEALHQRGATYDEIVAHLRRLDFQVSRSAVGRDAIKYKALQQRVRLSSEVAASLGKELGANDGASGRLVGEALKGLLFELLADKADGKFDSKEIGRMAMALKDLEHAHKLNVDTESKIRDRITKEVRAEAAREAETVCKRQGLSAAAINEFKATILGMPAS